MRDDMEFEKKRAAADKMRRAKAAFHYSDLTGALAPIIAKDRDAFSGLRLLFASDAAGVPIQSLLHGGDKNLSVSSIFCGRGFLGFSDKIDEEMRIGQSKLSFGSRTVLDTNFLSELPRFYEGIESDHSEKVGSTLRFINEKLGRGFEWSFASMENLREIVRGNNPWPYRKVAAAYFFDETGASAKNPDGFSAENPILERYFSQSAQYWSSAVERSATWEMIFLRDSVYCFILKAMLECWSGKDTEEALSNLVDFSLDEIGFIPLKELYFSWKALRGFKTPEQALRIFEEPALRKPRENSVRRVQALAWDLFIFRWVEFIASQTDEANFFIPLVTTLDQRLVDTIKACPLRAVIVHDDCQLAEAIFEDSPAFNEELDAAVTLAQRQRIADPSRLRSRSSLRRLRLAECIHNLEAEITTLSR